MSRIEDLYHKGQHEKSPTDLDNLILNAATKSCEETQVPSKRKTWLYALPTAAVVIMSLSMILNLQHENQDMMTAPAVESVPTTNAPAAKPQLTLKKQKPSKIAKDGFKAVEEHIPEALLENKQLARKPQESPHKKEKKANDYAISPAPVYQESVVGAIAADSAVDGLMEQEEDREKTARSGFIQSERNQSLAKRQKTSTLQSKIKTLELLIKEKNKKQAQSLLNKLKLEYPDNDFEKFDEILSNL